MDFLKILVEIQGPFFLLLTGVIFLIIGEAKNKEIDIFKIKFIASKNFSNNGWIIIIISIILIVLSFFPVVPNISENLNLELFSPNEIVILIFIGTVLIFIGEAKTIDILGIIISLSSVKVIIFKVIGFIILILGIFGIILSLPPLPPQQLPPFDIDISNSSRYDDGNGSSVNVTRIGTNSTTYEIYYDLKKNGWTTISNAIDSEELLKRKKIRILYKGSGKANTIEIKLVYGNMEGTTFGFFLNKATVTDDWASQEVSYDKFNCWWPVDSCQRNDGLNVSKIQKIEMSLSNKHGNEPGGGKIIIDRYQVVP